MYYKYFKLNQGSVIENRAFDLLTINDDKLFSEIVRINEYHSKNFRRYYIESE